MKKINCFLLAVICLALPLSSQAQLTTYEKLYGEIPHSDIFRDLEPTPDGGYVAVGQSHAAGKSGDFYFVKFDANGNDEISMNYGSEANENAFAVAVLADRYVIGGRRFDANFGTNDAYLVTLDLDGNIIDELVYGGSGEEEINAMTVLSNGNFAVAGTYEYPLPNGVDPNVRIYDANLNLIEELTDDSNLPNIPEFIAEVPETGDILVGGGFILTSYSSNLNEFNWITNGNSTVDHVQFDSFADGIAKDDDSFVFTSFSSEDGDIHVFYVDIASGEITDFFGLNAFLFQRPTGIAIEGNMVYVLVNQDENTVHPFNLTTESFEESIAIDFNALALTGTGNNKLALTGSEFVAEYDVTNTVQYDLTDFSEDWATALGDFTQTIATQGLTLTEADDGGMYLVGETRMGGEGEFPEVKKVDKSGVVLWETSFGEPNKVVSVFASTTTNDGGCTVAYYTQNDDLEWIVIVQKLSSMGDLEWTQTLENGNGFLNIFGNIIQSTDGGYYFGSTTFAPDGGFSAYVVKLSETGDVLWENNYTVEDFTTRCYNLLEASNGDVVVVGYNDGLVRQPIMVRVSASGDLIWERRYETTNAFSRFTGVTEATDGTIFAAGISTDLGFSSGQGILLHVDADGDIVDGGIVENNPVGTSIYDVVFKEDGSLHTLNIAVEQLELGQSASFAKTRTVSVYEYNPAYEVIDSQSFGFGTAPLVYRMIGHSDGGLAAYGSGFKDNTVYGYLIRIDAEGVSSTVDLKPQGSLTVSPTVSNGNFSVKFNSPHTGAIAVKIYNANGQIIHALNGQKSDENWQEELNLPELAKGNYFVNIQLNGYAWTRQIVSAAN